MPGANIIMNAGSLVATFAVTSGLGMAYWLVGAHYFSREAVGLAAAAISAMTLLSTIASLGLGTALIGELAKNVPLRRSITFRSLASATLTGAIFGIAFLIVTPYVTSGFHELSGDGAITAVAFCAGVAVMAAGVVFDGASIGLLKGGLQLARNAIFAIAKLTLLALGAYVLSRKTADGLIIAWVVGCLISLVFGIARLRSLPADGSIGRRDHARLLRIGVTHQTYNMAYSVSSLVLPIIVVTVVSVQANADFYVCFMLASALFIVPNALVTVLFAVGTQEKGELAASIRLTLVSSALICTFGAAVLAVFAHPILGLFGRQYSESAGALRVLTLVTFPLIIKNHFLSLTRIRGTVQRWLVPAWIGAVCETTAAYTGARIHGIEGLCWGWLIVVAIEALLMSPSVIKSTQVTVSPEIQ